MDTTEIPSIIIQEFLNGIDNLEYKRIVEKILNNKYTYKRLFSLLGIIKDKYEDSE